VYADHYGFSEKPFNLTPDPKFLYPSARHAEAYAHLEFGRRERGGFVVITGEVGTGKTTLARSFLSRIDDETATAVVLYPALTAVELLSSILDDLHIEAAGHSLKDQIDALSEFLLEARRRDRNVVLLIDEAQDLSPEVLEQIRLISNLETDTEKLLTIVLMGQSELREMLARPELRQLAQRVTAWYHITPLDPSETEDYVRHRLRVAGGTGKVEFTSPALAAIHRASHGIPRVINLIADRALLAGYVDGTRIIDATLVARATGEIQSGMPTRPFPLRTVLVASGALLIAAVAFWTRSPIAGEVVEAQTPEPSAVAVREAPGPDTEPLGPLVRDQAGAQSYQAAVRAVGELWQERPTQRTELRTHLKALRRIDLPVILEMFHPSRPGTSFVALLTIEGSSARIVGADGAARWVRLDELDRLWTHRAEFLWRDYDAVAAAEDPADIAAWVRRSLDRLGYLEEGIDLRTAVTRFQGDAELAPDGLVGERTLMALYTSGEYPRPRLSAGGL